MSYEGGRGGEQAGNCTGCGSEGVKATTIIIIDSHLK